MRTARKLVPLAVLAMVLCGAVTLPSEARVRVRRHVVVWRPHARVRLVVGPIRVVKTVVVLEGRPAGQIDFDVDPSETKVFVDGTYRGTVDDFDGFPQKLTLHAGLHHLRLQSPSGDEVEQEVTLKAGTEISVDLELQN